MRITSLSISALLMVFLVACDQPDVPEGADSSTRKRLSSNASFAKFGDYEVHVNGLVAAELTPEVAQTFGITRSENRGMVNLVVLRQGEGDAQQMPVKAGVTVSAANLTAQSKSITMREVIDGPSIYYIGDLPVNHEETITFDFDVRPEGSTRVLPIRFVYQFYTK